MSEREIESNRSAGLRACCFHGRSSEYGMQERRPLLPEATRSAWRIRDEETQKKLHGRWPVQL